MFRMEKPLVLQVQELWSLKLTVSNSVCRASRFAYLVLEPPGCDKRLRTCFEDSPFPCAAA